jgi:hypothetical protein
MTTEQDRGAQNSLLTHDALWRCQLTHWPDSKRLTAGEVFQWCNAPRRIHDKLMRWQMAGMALQYPAHVWYRTKQEGGSMGCRYGLEAPNYLSNFDDLERKSEAVRVLW